MLVVRPVETRDVNAVVALAEALGTGMTTFPPDRAVLSDKIESSVETFAGRADPEDAQYLLVLEDTDTGAVLGTAALYPSIGSPYGFFSYKVNTLVHRSRELGVGMQTEVLSLANDYTGATEVGTLAVAPSLRGGGAGRFLARSRYMLIAAFPELFAPKVMAEMRGWQDDEGRSPFWDAVGAKFFNMDFDTADKLSAVRGNEFIADLQPKYPIYAALLPEAAKAAIGRPHRASAPAMAMLLEENFRYESLVDVFDAGPQVHADRDKIRTVAASRVRPVTGAGTGEEIQVLACTGRLDGFRVMRTTAVLADGGVRLSEAGAQSALDIGEGEEVRLSPADFSARSPLEREPLLA